jgi:hypothetical protein
MELSEQSSVASVSAPMVRIRNNRMQAGFILSCVCGVIGLATVSFSPPESLSLIALFTLLLIPLGLGLVLTGRPTDALTLVWINEMFFGGSGHWLEFGPVPIRWLLLVALIVLGGAQTLLPSRSSSVRVGRRRPMFSRWVVFYGAFVPVCLVAYSVLVKDTPFWTAIADVNYLFALLTYFALRGLLQRRFDLLRGWIIGGVFTLALFFLMMSLSPAQFVRPIITSLSGATVGTTESGINRAALVSQILLVTGVFLGSLYTIDRTQPSKRRLAGFILFSLSVASYVFMFLRGPLVSISFVVILFILATIRHRRLRSNAVRLVVAFTLVGISAFVLYSIAVPEALDKFAVSEGGFSSFVGEARIEQADQMLSAFAENPIFGQGAGVPIPGYSRSGEAGLQFELQYHMMLYRFGLVAFGLLFIPIVWFFVDLFRVVGKDNTIVQRSDGKFMLAVLLSSLSIFVAGAFNPYLTAIFTPFLMILYLACRELTLPMTIKRGGQSKSPDQPVGSRRG